MRLGEGDPEVGAITYHSGRVEPGGLFVAIVGLKQDGHAFVREAVARGAAAVAVERLEAAPDGHPALLVPDSRLALSLAAAELFGHASKRLRLVGVTGTNGKTTTTNLIRACHLAADRPTGLIGTVEAIVGGQRRSVSRTTPEGSDLQALLADMVAAGDQVAVMEAASHGMWLRRVAACEFDGAVFTNLTRDHLEHHGTMEEYARAKAMLFESLGRPYRLPAKDGPRYAVLNRDDPAAGRMARDCLAPIWTYGLGRPADGDLAAPERRLWASDVEVTGQGARFRLHWAGKVLTVRLSLTGRFNVYNAMAALGAALGEGLDLERSLAAVEGVQSVSGRFERVDLGQPFTVVVDYAHTPDGLVNVLDTARELTPGRVIVVFGAGGDRDRQKRPMMGRVTAERADVLVVTSDNPRTEDPEQIIDDIAAGVEEAIAAGARPEWHRERDRRQAMALSFQLARPGDTVLIAGKGHETVQVIGDRQIPFDDRAVAREILASLGARSGEVV